VRPAAVDLVAGEGRNPISILVPCHRRIGGDGSRKGFADGLARKAVLCALDNPGRSAQPCLF